MQNFVKNTDGSFTLGGKSFRFVGANVYELANLESAITKRIIDDSAEAGFTALRFWLFENRPVKEQIKRLNEICDAVNPYGIKLIISLADKWGYLQYYKIDEDWYREGYQSNYLNYVKALTGEFAQRDEIMIWELINEPETDNFNVFYDFAKAASEEIKKVNENHLLSVGTVGGVGDKFGSYFSVFNKSNFRKLYSLSSLDAVSLHDYSYDSGLFERLDILYRFKGELKKAERYSRFGSSIEKPFAGLDGYFLKKGKLFRFPLTLRWLWNIYNSRDTRFAASLKKPVYIGEIGFKNIPGRDRVKILDLDIKKKFESGVGGIMLWSFESQGWNKDGHDYGFGLGEGFENVVKKWNTNLNNESI
ncbi:MAG: cellulase family glycosylhydrolase [Ignavibacteria bacterium]|nr:cellulase family glycosylhydrolase [Ignavibacteria bacterium]